MPQKINIALKNGTAKSGTKYTYVQILIDEVVIDRIFLKETEKEFFSKLEGEYKLQKI